MTNRMALMASVAGLTIIASGSAQAQDAPAGAPAAQDTTASQLDEVVVTAERQTRNLQTTPVAVTAITAQQLENRGVRNIFDLQNLVPSLSIAQQTNQGGASGAVFFLRGLGGRAGTSGSEPAVALYIDDFYNPSASGNALRALDLEQVEVLRGPQGTLFGRNAVGGAIRYQTKKPTHEFGAFAEATLGYYDRRDFLAGVNIPLGDTFAVRLSGATFEADGIQKKQTSPGTVGASEDRLGRIQARYTPNDRLTVDLSYDQSESELAGSPTYVPVIVGTGQLSGLYNATHAVKYDSTFISTCILCSYGSLPRDSSDKASARNVHGVIDYRVSDTLQVKFLSGYSLSKDNFFNDIDASPLLIGNQYSTVRSEAWSQELQVLGDLGSRIHYVAGLYAFDEKFHAFSGQELFIRTTSVTQDRERESYSAYGNVNFDLTDRLILTGGIRVGNETVTTSAVTNAGVSAANDQKYDVILPLARLQFQATPDLMIYASASKGLRGGGFSVAPNPALPNAGIVPFDPETVWSYEVGARTQFLDHRLRINPTVFYTDYSDIQVQRIIGTTPVLENAGTAHIFGVELEATFVVTSALRFTAQGSYLDAEYDTLLPGVVGIQLSTPFAQTSKFSYSVGAQYTVPLDNGADVALNLDYSDRTKYTTSAQETDDLLIQGQGLVNARAEFHSPSGRYTLAAWSTNLLDEHYVSGGVDLTSLVGLIRYDIGRPREFGLTFKAKY
jgi:iron complex outermembrane receptor protein